MEQQYNNQYSPLPVITFEDLLAADAFELTENPYILTNESPITPPPETSDAPPSSTGKIKIIEERTDINQKFGLEKKYTTFKFNQVPDNTDPINYMKDGVKEMIDSSLANTRESDYIGFSFRNNQYSKDGYVMMQQIKNFNLEQVWDLLTKIAQSNDNGLNIDTFTLTSCYIKGIHGGGGRGGGAPNIKYDNYDQECNGRSSIIVISNYDKLCLPRAIVVSMAFVDNDPNYTLVSKSFLPEQQVRAIQLCKNSNVNIDAAEREGGMGIESLDKFQAYLGPKGYRIVVFKYLEGCKKEKIYVGSEDDTLKNIFLYYNNENHYNVLTSLTASLVGIKICNSCFKSYRKVPHFCAGKCWGCLAPKKCQDMSNKIVCNDCNRTFLGQSCFNNHLLTNCHTHKKCLDCFRTYTDKRVHTCGEFRCKTCNTLVPSDHLCFMQKNMNYPTKKSHLYIFYDFESTQEKNLGEKTKDGLALGPVLEHEVNLCVYKQICSFCLYPHLEGDCLCNNREVVVLKESPVNTFMKYLLQLGKKDGITKIIIIGHNSGGYDAQFILKEMVNCTQHNPEIIARGTRIMQMVLKKKLFFIDSLNFLPLSLKALPAAFSLGLEVKKGTFPHLFNTKENFDKVLECLPDIEYYSPDLMMEKEKKEFQTWYETNKNKPFNVQEELINYCINDVEILTQACLKFREMFLQICNVDPFYEAITLAGAGNKAFRRGYLKDNVIGLIPKHGYRFADQQSSIAIHWLLYIEKKTGKKIQHAGNGFEKKINNVKVDGYHEETKTIYQFHGCYFHGHGCKLGNPSKPDRNIGKSTTSWTTQGDRYEKTKAMSENFKRLGYKVVEIYECQFREILKKDVLAKNLESHPILKVAKLDIRDALYGGRTESFKSFYECQENERIHYLDICSLYPFIVKNKPFPKGHPDVILGEDCKKIDLKNTHGFIKCKWLAPRDLLIPVLPFKQNGKLMFSLCFTCSENPIETECLHSENERAFIGNYAIPEMNKAVEKGYKILETYEIWKYQSLQYDPSTDTPGLFSDYMNVFIKIKQEASGWPSHCKSEEDKQNYIQNFYEVERVKLEYNKIEKNPALRSFAKLLLNSFWGKFAESSERLKSVIVGDVNEMYEILANPKLKVAPPFPLNHEKLLIQYRMEEEEVDELPYINVAIAAYTTAFARLELYSYLERLNENLIYSDTDSIVFFTTGAAGEYVPETGDYIGNMTDELSGYGEGAYIKKFFSAGPKSYTYEVIDAKGESHYVTKMKGIRLNHESAKKINFASLSQLVKQKQQEPTITVNYKNIRRFKNFTVVTTPEQKVIKGNYNKRKFNDNSSVPHGYKKQKTG